MKAALILLAVACWAATAQAHKPSDSYLSLRADGTRVAGQWDIALRDLDHAIGLDANSDGGITWGEVRQRHAAIAAYALAHLQLAAGDATCRLSPRAHLIDNHSDGTYAVLRFVADCDADTRSLTVRYNLFFDFDPQHRGLLQLTSGGATRTLVFSKDAGAQRIDLATGGSWLQTLGTFWHDGIWHIWAGFDHVLFLLALLMPAVLRRVDDGWRELELREAFISTLKVVTAFTLAHSITLTLAALGAIQLPSRLVESGIALSVIVAAVNNAWPLFADGRWLVGFGFGLLHGFGFATVLADTDVPRAALLQALLGFNLGVETGQLAIVCAFLPLAYALRRSWMYQRVTLVVGSSLIAVLAMIWLVERALDLRLLS